MSRSAVADSSIGRVEGGKRKKKPSSHINGGGARYCVVMITCPARVAKRIARAVLDGRAAACVNVIPRVRSLYLWKGKVEDAHEALLLVKTRIALVDKLERVVKGVHPYDVPEMIVLPITRGYTPYLEWIAAESMGGPEASKGFSGR